MSITNERRDRLAKALAECGQRTATAPAFTRELRDVVTGSEIRAENDGDQKILSGTAVVYRALSQNLGTDAKPWKERFLPGSFQASLAANPDLRMLHSHDSARVLGRVKAGTLSITDTPTGLRFRCILPRSADDIFESVDRGDTTGMSFGFRCVQDDWSSESDPETGERIDVRNVLSARIDEISSTAFPAYTSTSLDAMTRALWPEGQPQELRDRLQNIRPDAARAERLRRTMAEIGMTY